MTDAARRVRGVLVAVLAVAGPAAAAGLPDILGIRLGMPLKEAYAKVQAQFPKNKIQENTTQLPTIAKPVIRYFVSSGAAVEGQESDTVTEAERDLSAEQAGGLEHRPAARVPGQGHAKTTFLASLREKYGKETRAITGRAGRRPMTRSSRGSCG